MLTAVPGRRVISAWSISPCWPGFQTVPVAYRGNTQLSTDLVAGQIKFGFVGGGGVIQHIRAGRLKGLATSSRQRSLLAPDMPTIAELGYADFEFEAYFPLAVPSHTPEPVAALLEREIRKALDVSRHSRAASSDGHESGCIDRR